METYLRPETLFCTKFEAYLNQSETHNGKEQMPSYWDPEPIRKKEQKPATKEEIEQIKKLIQKGSNQ